MKRVLLRLALLLPLLVGCAARGAELGDFKTFTSKDGRFTAEFPGEPTIIEQPIDTAIGQMTAHTFHLQQGNSEYTVAYSDLPATLTEAQLKKLDADKGLDGARDGIVSSTKSRLAKESKITLGKWPGREWRLEGASDGNEDLLWRCYYVKARQYQIGIGWLKGNEPPKEIIDAFLNSLKLTAE